jgi:2-polyprenyl-6-methoxyphenol hydroxylase-like FAD-dependent oxidoreductase
MRRIPVLIAGGGPIGLALAADLGRRGVETLLVEKHPDALDSAKMIQVSVRTMEFCRQLGISEEIWNWGFPHDHNMDSAFVTTLRGYALGRVTLPTLAQQRNEPESPERDIHCPQTWFDPILQRYARRFPHVALRYSCALDSFEQDEDGVNVTLLDVDTGTREIVHADYLAGCDGYASTVRELLGIEMRGERFLDLSMSVYVRIPNLGTTHDRGDAYRYLFIGPDGTWGVLTTIDGYDLYRLQLIGSNETDVRAIDVAAAVRRGIGDDVPFTIEDVSFWARKMMVADRFSDGRVFLAGDASHAHPPNGGLGMNTGIGDAFDLGWKLAAGLAGWGGPALIASYDVERRPACARAAEESLRNYRRLTAGTRFPDIENPTAIGDRVRAELGARLVAENEKAWHPLGVHLGYIYDPSPIVVPDGSPRPSDDPIGYRPSAYPGARAPHAWITEGRSTLDLFGERFALLMFDASSAEPFVTECARVRMPLDVHYIDDPVARMLYDAPMVLVRPDGHVAWRGDARESHVAGVIRTVRGAGPQIVARRTAP